MKSRSGQEIEEAALTMHDENSTSISGVGPEASARSDNKKNWYEYE